MLEGLHTKLKYVLTLCLKATLIMLFIILFIYFLYYIGLLTGFHYLHLLIGMILSRVIREFYNYSYVNMGTVAMVVVNLLALLAVNDPPYYRMKFCEKWSSIYNLDYNLQIQDYCHTKVLHHNYYKV